MSLLWESRHPRMRSADTIDIIGYNGDRCRVAGPGMHQDWGPVLSRGSTGLFGMPFNTTDVGSLVCVGDSTFPGQGVNACVCGLESLRLMRSMRSMRSMRPELDPTP